MYSLYAKSLLKNFVVIPDSGKSSRLTFIQVTQLWTIVLYLLYCFTLNVYILQVEGSIDVNINAEDTVEETQKAKEEPAWLSQASSFITAQITHEDTESSQVCVLIFSAISLLWLW